MNVAACFAWRKYSRGLGWLLVAFLGALLIDNVPGLADAYTGRWLGACLKAATGAWGGYRISRDILRIDPSEGVSPYERAILHLARAVVVGLTIVAVCLSL